MVSDKNIAWIDLEMTGLDISRDVILEIAVIVTDENLTVLAEGPHFVVKQEDHFLKNMLPEVVALHQASGLIERLAYATVTDEQAQNKVLSFLRAWGVPGRMVLAGNTIYQDRIFLRKYLPKVDAFFHYRMIDVSSFKEVVNRWYDGCSGVPFFKKKSHRALDDVKESIEELRFYRNNFFIAR